MDSQPAPSPYLVPVLLQTSFFTFTCHVLKLCHGPLRSQEPDVKFIGRTGQFAVLVPEEEVEPSPGC